MNFLTGTVKFCSVPQTFFFSMKYGDMNFLTGTVKFCSVTQTFFFLMKFGEIHSEQSGSER